ncbi:MAG: hypothetical protein PHQ00_00310 [Phycisphaerae bacterium]|nr:hypothetical protein [Phycisphaerae bacterium]
MGIEKNWIYYNIHDLIRIRLQNGHPSERSFDLFFGSFKTDFLSEDKIDISVQKDALAISGYSNFCNSYYSGDNHLYFIKYKIHLQKNSNFWILAGQRDLLTFIHPVTQMLFLRKKHCIIHSASVAINGRGVLLPACGGTGKTSAIISILKEIRGSSFLSDDFSFISSYSIYSNPKAFAIYPYHRSVFPHLFCQKHNFLIPSCLSNVFEKIRVFSRPTIMALPKLENIAKRLSPDRMYAPAREALKDFEFSDNAKIDTILLLERYSGNKAVLENISAEQVRSRLIGNWLYEIGNCGQEMLVAMSGTGIIDLSEYFSQMGAVVNSACQNKTVKLLRMPKMTPSETGKLITATLKDIMKID